MYAYLLAAVMLLASPQHTAHQHPVAAKSQQQKQSAIKAVNDRKPPGCKWTLRQHFARLSHLAKINKGSLKNTWSAKKQGNNWVVTMISAPGGADNTATWRVSSGYAKVSPMNALAKGIEDDMRSMQH